MFDATTLHDSFSSRINQCFVLFNKNNIIFPGIEIKGYKGVIIDSWNSPIKHSMQHFNIKFEAISINIKYKAFRKIIKSHLITGLNKSFVEIICIKVNEGINENNQSTSLLMYETKAKRYLVSDHVCLRQLLKRQCQTFTSNSSPFARRVNNFLLNKVK